MILPVLAIGVSILALVISFKAFRFFQEAHIANRRPHLIFSEDDMTNENGTLYTGFFLRNIGLGPAFNIKIEEAYIKKYDFLKEFSKIPRNLSPNGKTLFARVQGYHRFINNDLTLEVKYEDHEGRKYRTVLKELNHYFYEDKR